MDCTADGVLADRHGRSIINCAPNMLNSSFHARREVKVRDDNKRDIDATALRMYGTKKATQLIHFMHSMSVSMNDYFVEAITISQKRHPTFSQRQLSHSYSFAANCGLVPNANL